MVRRSQASVDFWGVAVSSADFQSASDLFVNPSQLRHVTTTFRTFQRIRRVLLGFINQIFDGTFAFDSCQIAVPRLDFQLVASLFQVIELFQVLLKASSAS